MEMGAHGQPKQDVWSDAPTILKWTALTAVVVTTAVILMLFIAGSLWLIGHPLASQCGI